MFFSCSLSCPPKAFICKLLEIAQTAKCAKLPWLGECPQSRWLWYVPSPLLALSKRGYSDFLSNRLFPQQIWRLRFRISLRCSGGLVSVMGTLQFFSICCLRGLWRDLELGVGRGSGQRIRSFSHNWKVTEASPGTLPISPSSSFSPTTHGLRSHIFGEIPPVLQAV